MHNPVYPSTTRTHRNACTHIDSIVHEKLALARIIGASSRSRAQYILYIDSFLLSVITCAQCGLAFDAAGGVRGHRRAAPKLYISLYFAFSYARSCLCNFQRKWKHTRALTQIDPNLFFFSSRFPYFLSESYEAFGIYIFYLNSLRYTFFFNAYFKVSAMERFCRSNTCGISCFSLRYRFFF